jgi:hypothetical protein
VLLVVLVVFELPDWYVVELSYPPVIAVFEPEVPVAD